MKEDKLIEYKENLFTKIFLFFKKIFFRRNVSSSKKISVEIVKNSESKTNFYESIQLKEDNEIKRLKQLQLLYDNGEIDEDDLSDEEIEKLVALYEKETEKLNTDTLRRKKHIQEMLKELKSS